MSGNPYKHLVIVSLTALSTVGMFTYMHDYSDLTPENILGKLQHRGHGRQVRIEFELLSISDMKDIAREIGDLAEALKDLSKAKALSPFERLCRARQIIYDSNRRGPARKQARTRREATS